MAGERRRALLELLTRPGNVRCADCGAPGRCGSGGGTGCGRVDGTAWGAGNADEACAGSWLGRGAARVHLPASGTGGDGAEYPEGTAWAPRDRYHRLPSPAGLRVTLSPAAASPPQPCETSASQGEKKEEIIGGG